MAVNLTSPVTGSAQTGFTSPTYTLTADTAPDINGKQWAVTALGRTQTNVLTHSATNPFTTSVFRPKAYKALGKPHPVTGLIASVPNNTHKVITRKGVLPQSGQPYRNFVISTIMDVPAGSDTNDAPNLRAGLSMHIGALSQQSAGIGDTVTSGVL